MQTAVTTAFRKPEDWSSSLERHDDDDALTTAEPIDSVSVTPRLEPPSLQKFDDALTTAEPLEASVTPRLAPPSLRKFPDEWSSSLERVDDSMALTTAEPLAPVRVPEPPIEPPRILRVIRNGAPGDRGFVVARGMQIGKYLLDDKLGHGTFGSVYTARDTELERRVAVKVLNPQHQSNIEAVTRFLQEARATARINHVGIVTILEVGRIPTDLGEVGYIVMELLEGETLARRIGRVGRLDAAVAIEIGHQISGALGAAHKADVLHRDVKPDNIFLVRDPVLASGERVKVLDFGLAKLGRGGQTSTYTILGTPRYMSPEQARSSAHVDKRSDIYSLGCVLFELLVGRRPFEGDPSMLIDRHEREIPPRVKTLVPALPKSLDDLIARMLAKAPAARPQSMEEVQQELLAAATLGQEGRQEVALPVGRTSVDRARTQAEIAEPAKAPSAPAVFPRLARWCRSKLAAGHTMIVDARRGVRGSRQLIVAAAIALVLLLIIAIAIVVRLVSNGSQSDDVLDVAPPARLAEPPTAPPAVEPKPELAPQPEPAADPGPMPSTKVRAVPVRKKLAKPPR
jgi:serine/threonine protein kinase